MESKEIKEGVWVHFCCDYNDFIIGDVCKVFLDEDSQQLYVNSYKLCKQFSLDTLLGLGIIKFHKENVISNKNNCGIDEGDMKNVEKILGKIKHITFGIGGYNESMLGYDIEFSLEGGSMGLNTSNGFFDFNRIKHTEHCKWSMQDREDAAVIMLKDLSDILAKAKVRTVDKLVGIPVEVSIESNTIKSWRVLTEVL